MKNLRDYITLTKPRLNFLAIVTTLGGFYLASPRPMNITLLLFALLGSTCVAAGCGVLNQWLEADTDARMSRTRKRPLPSGRVEGRNAFWFGIVLSVVGVGVLEFKTNDLTAFLGMCALVSYVILYTPLKKLTSLCTVVGAIPGAIPPLMGWTAAQDAIGPGGWTLFFILFLWQMPHFLAIAWMYREDYARAGFPMLTVLDKHGESTGLMAVAYSMALVPVSLLPTYLGITGAVYFWAALVLSLGFVWTSFLLARHKTLYHARGLFWSSITYLPLLFLIMVLDKR
jgi:protoheme IX farnesyltransferase